VTQALQVPLPAEIDVVVDRDTRELDGGRLVGGMPRRMLRLSDAGRAAFAEIRDGRAGSPASGQLARRLTDAGLAHPRAATSASPANVTVVIPVRDRVAQLDRCLASLGTTACIVVDDGSADPAAVASVAASHGARLARRDVASGPAAARNDGLAGISTDLIAFLDSDCVAWPGWVEELAGHFADPLVGAVAPRIVPSRRHDSSRYLDRVGLHDLGLRESRVQPGGRVAFVPTAALLVRRTALEAVAGETVFDATLRYGEDVDLVWRLDAAGWRVRYDPAVEIAHDEPFRWSGRLARRFHYGTSAAPLSLRHPKAVGHLIVAPWPLAAVAGVVGGRPSVMAVATAGTFVTTRRALRRADVSELSATRLAADSLAGTWRGVGRYVTQFGLPLLAAGAVRGRRPTRRRAIRAASVAALAVSPAVAEWWQSRPGVSLARFVAGRLADDAAYGVGVYVGCLKERTAAPLAVVVSRKTGERRTR
jgi:mycofactocin system glycosyltransferase